MRILLYDWNENSTYINRWDIKQTFCSLHIDFDTFLFDFEKQEQEELVRLFSSFQISKYDFCFSINYFPGVSEACMENNIKYISWGYDCPFNVKNIERTLGNPCNYVFCFDRVQAEGYIRQGFDTVFYMPLGVNVDRYEKIMISSEYLAKYGGDISFIGSLYEGQYSAIAEVCDDYHRGYLEAIINSQQQLYGGYILNDAISQGLVDEINRHFKEVEKDTKFSLTKEQLVHVLDQETSRRERLLLLTLLARRFDVHLYSYQAYQGLTGVKLHDAVDYVTEMPYVFASSKINLNISVKGIQSGMPQRTLDIMASGGFLLSNFQPELVEYFSCGEDMETYSSMEEAVVKSRFYLENPDIRERIAKKGRERVYREHNLKDKICQMIEFCKEN
ncbi:MAG: DUF3880 domain-containing protein [Lachnospiraceae bacterium]|nr:DUF3880 domain-containing protein [Lachnospiraceae bacterium]